MARILRWQEKLVLACAALFFSVTSGWGLGPRDSAGYERASSSRLVTVTGGKSAVGIELMSRKPYVRLIRAPGVPVSLPLTTGAYVALASAMGAAAAPAGNGAAPAPDPAAAFTGSACGATHTHGTTGGTHLCYTLYCSGGFVNHPGDTCETCGYGTCGGCC